MYCNTLDPLLNQYLALGVYMFTRNAAEIVSEDPKHMTKVFASGEDSDRKMANWMSRRIKNATEAELIELDMYNSEQKVIAESIRKGALSYLSGCTAVTIVAVSRRGGHSIGHNMGNVYWQSTEDADDIAGRVSSLLNVNKPTFDVLSPHFHTPEIATYQQHMNSIIPGYSGNNNMILVLLYCYYY